MASTSYWWSGWTDRTVMTTWTSLRSPLTKLGRSGRSMSRQVRMASVVGRPSRRKNEPGIRPAAYIRSSTSTVRGKKSKPSRGLCRRRRRQDHRLVVEIGADRSAGLPGQAPGLEPDGAGAERAVVDDCFGAGDLWTLHGPPFRFRTSVNHAHHRCARGVFVQVVLRWCLVQPGMPRRRRATGRIRRGRSPVGPPAAGVNGAGRDV